MKTFKRKRGKVVVIYQLVGLPIFPPCSARPLTDRKLLCKSVSIPSFLRLQNLKSNRITTEKLLFSCLLLKTKSIFLKLREYPFRGKKMSQEPSEDGESDWLSLRFHSTLRCLLHSYSIFATRVVINSSAIHTDPVKILKRVMGYVGEGE